MYRKIYQKLAGRGLGRWFPVNFFANLAVKNLTGDYIAKVHDYEMIVPIKEPQGYVLYLKHNYEPVVTKYIKKFLHEGRTFVDVGACLGYYSLLTSGIVGPKGRVLALEPDLKNYSYAHDNIMMNDFTDNIHLIEAAASDKKGKANLNISEHNIGCHSLFKSKLSGHTDEVAIVPTVRIDEVIDHVDMIKIDVEGHEYQVLKGMSRLFDNNDNDMIIIQEFCPRLLNNDALKDLMTIWERYAHNLFVIDEKKKKLKPTCPENLFQIGLSDMKEGINLIWWA